MKRSTILCYCFIGGICLLMAISCGKKTSEPDFADPRRIQLQSLFDNGVVPSHNAFVVSVIELLADAEKFVADPTSDALVEIKEAWQESTLQWKRCEVYEFGEVQNLFLHTRIHRWPVEEVGLEENLHIDEVIDEAFISRKGSSIIGLAAMEYLLFRDSPEATLDTFTTSENHRKYLVATVKHLRTVAEELQMGWASEGPSFVQRTGLNIEGGQNQLVNGLIAHLDKTIRFRLRTPSGEQSGDAPDPGLVETPFAAHSLACLQAGFEEWKVAYHGGGTRLEDYGFTDYLAELGNTSLSPRIDAAITQIDARIDALSEAGTVSSLQDLLIREPEEFNELTADFQALLILIRVDLSSAISVVLTVNDADGD